MGLTGHLTAFDWAALGLVAASAFIGLARGAVREVTGLAAMAIAGLLALGSGRWLGSLFMHAIHPAWLAKPAGMAGVFLLTYVVLRMAAGVLTRGVRGAGLSGVDRLLGLGIGAARGVAALGVFALALGAVFGTRSLPGWIDRAQLYPLARGTGAVLRSAAPRLPSLQLSPRTGSDTARAESSASLAPRSLVVVEDSH